MSLDQQTALALAETLRDIANTPHARGNLRASEAAAILYAAEAIPVLVDYAAGQLAATADAGAKTAALRAATPEQIPLSVILKQIQGA